jgi:hypothetical protein
MSNVGADLPVCPAHNAFITGAHTGAPLHYSLFVNRYSIFIFIFSLQCPVRCCSVSFSVYSCYDIKKRITEHFDLQLENGSVLYNVIITVPAKVRNKLANVSV